MTAAEAKATGLVTRVFPSRTALEEGVADLASGNLVITILFLKNDRIDGKIDGGDEENEVGDAG